MLCKSPGYLLFLGGGGKTMHNFSFMKQCHPYSQQKTTKSSNCPDSCYLISTKIVDDEQQTWSLFTRRQGSFFFISRLKTYRYHLHSTVPSIVKKDFRSPSLHYGWHSQLRLIFSNKTKTRTTKPIYMT